MSPDGCQFVMRRGPLRSGVKGIRGASILFQPAPSLSSSVMQITRIYTGEDGESHFEDVEVPLLDRGHIGQISRLEEATGVVFRETGGDYDFDFHCAPRRQYVINLDAPVELEVGDGTKRVLGPGDVLLAEDTTGRGHRSRAVDGRPRRSIFVTLD